MTQKQHRARRLDQNRHDCQRPSHHLRSHSLNKHIFAAQFSIDISRVISNWNSSENKRKIIIYVDDVECGTPCAVDCSVLGGRVRTRNWKSGEIERIVTIPIMLLNDWLISLSAVGSGSVRYRGRQFYCFFFYLCFHQHYFSIPFHPAWRARST